MNAAQGRTPHRALTAMPLACAALMCGAAASLPAAEPDVNDETLNRQLKDVLAANSFTSNIQSSVEQRLGRPIDQQLQNLGRQLFFDPIHALHDDNSCAGCHDPAAGFGDSQAIAIGVQNEKMIVGTRRDGPRHQRRAPTIINAASAATWRRSAFACPTAAHCSTVPNASAT